MDSYFNLIAKAVILTADPNTKKALSKVSEYSEPSVSTVAFFFLYNIVSPYIRLPTSFISLMSLQSRYDGTQETPTKEIALVVISFLMCDISFFYCEILAR